MKLIFLMALVAFASAADKKEPELTNPAQPDETNVIFNCPTDKPKGFCVRRTKDGYSVKLAHHPKYASEKDKLGFNCISTNAENNYCCKQDYIPTPKKERKRLSKRQKGEKPDPEATIFQKIPDNDLKNHCSVQAGKGK